MPQPHETRDQAKSIDPPRATLHSLPPVGRMDMLKATHAEPNQPTSAGDIAGVHASVGWGCVAGWRNKDGAGDRQDENITGWERRVLDAHC